MISPRKSPQTIMDKLTRVCISFCRFALPSPPARRSETPSTSRGKIGVGHKEQEKEGEKKGKGRGKGKGDFIGCYRA